MSVRPIFAFLVTMCVVINVLHIYTDSQSAPVDQLHHYGQYSTNARK